MFPPDGADPFFPSFLPSAVSAGVAQFDLSPFGAPPPPETHGSALSFSYASNSSSASVRLPASSSSPLSGTRPVHTYTGCVPLGNLRVVNCRHGEPEALQKEPQESGSANVAPSPSSSSPHSSSSPPYSSSPPPSSSPPSSSLPWSFSEFFRGGRSRRILPCTLTDRDATLNAVVSSGGGLALTQFDLQLRHLVTGERPPAPWLDYCMRRGRKTAESSRKEETPGAKETGQDGEEGAESREGDDFVRNFLAVDAEPRDLPSCPVLSAAQVAGLSLLLAGARATVGVCEGGRFSWEVKILALERETQPLAFPPCEDGKEGVDDAREAQAADRRGASQPEELATGVTGPDDSRADGEDEGKICQPPAGDTSSSFTFSSSSSSSCASSSLVNAGNGGASFSGFLKKSAAAVSPLSLRSGLVRVGVCTAGDSLFLGDSATSLGIDSEGGCFAAGRLVCLQREKRDASSSLSSLAASSNSQIHPASVSTASDFASGGVHSQREGPASVSPSEAICPVPDGELPSEERAWEFQEGDVITVVLNMRKEISENGRCAVCGGEIPKETETGEKETGEKGKTEEAGGGSVSLPSVWDDEENTGKREEGRRKRRRRRCAVGPGAQPAVETGRACEGVREKGRGLEGRSGSPKQGESSPECSCWSVSFFLNGARLLGAVKLPNACKGQVLYPCFNVRGAATVLVNFGSRPPFCALPFWCPMLQDHCLSSPPHVFPSPSQVAFSPAEDPAASPLSAEATLCVGLPGCGLFDFLDCWKREREKSRGRPITEISSRAVALWIRLSLFAVASLGNARDTQTLFDAENTDSEPFPASPADWTASGFAADVIRAVSVESGTSPTAVGGERHVGRGDAPWSWRGGPEGDSVADPLALQTGVAALDDLSRVKSALLLLAASSRRGDLLVADVVGSLQQSRRREFAALFSEPVFSRRCLLVVGPPPLAFAARLQAKLHREQPRLRSLIRQLRRRRAEAEEAGDVSLCGGLDEDLVILEQEIRDARVQPCSPTFAPTKAWTNGVVDDVPLWSLSSQLEEFSLPSADEGFETEVAWRESVEEAEKNFQLWRVHVAARRLQDQLKPPLWFKPQLAVWAEKRLALQEYQRAVSARYARALVHLDGGSTVLSADFDFGFADLTQVMRDGGDASNSCVTKLMQALKSVEEHAASSLALSPEAAAASHVSPQPLSPTRVSGSSYAERLEFVTKKAEEEIASYSTNVDFRFPAHLSEGPWIPVLPLFPAGSDPASSYPSSSSFPSSFSPSFFAVSSPGVRGSQADAAKSGASAADSGVPAQKLQTASPGDPSSVFEARTVPQAAASASDLAPSSAEMGSDESASLAASALEDIVREHQVRMEQVNKAAALAHPAGVPSSGPALLAAPAANAPRSGDDLGKNSPVPREGCFPLFIHFESEDWKMLEARVEIHMFLHAFSQVVKENEGRVPVEWFSVYYNLFFDRSLNVEDFPSCLSLDDFFEQLTDTVGVADEPPFVFPLFPAHAPLATFIALTEKARRLRRFKVEEKKARKLRSWKIVTKYHHLKGVTGSGAAEPLSPRLSSQHVDGRGKLSPDHGGAAELRRRGRGGTYASEAASWDVPRGVQPAGNFPSTGSRGGGGAASAGRSRYRGGSREAAMYSPYAGATGLAGYERGSGQGNYYYDPASVQQYMQYVHAYQQQYMYYQQMMPNQ